MGIYEPLTRHLKALSGNSWSTSFTEVERVLRRPLPSSAYEYRPWWGNQKKGNHSQARAWRAAGWETRDVDLKRKTVRFERIPKGTEPGSDPEKYPSSGLWDQATAISGIRDREKLIEAALTALIQREAARGLIALGGSDPAAKTAPRERPWE